MSKGIESGQPNSVGLAGLQDLAWMMREASSSGSETKQGLQQAFSTLVGEETLGKGADATRKELLEPVVYMVANYVPVSGFLHLGFQRVVVGAARRGVFGSGQLPSDSSNLPVDPALFDLFFFGTGRKDDVEERRLKEAWSRNWAAYAITTKENEQKGLITWNQFLLTHTQRPTVIGISWSADVGQLARHYTDVLPAFSGPIVGIAGPIIPEKCESCDQMVELAERWNCMLPIGLAGCVSAQSVVT